MQNCPLDLGVITPVCICGSQMWEVEWIIFNDDYEIAAYSLNMKCIECGNKAITPTPIDKVGN